MSSEGQWNEGLRSVLTDPHGDEHDHRHRAATDALGVISARTEVAAPPQRGSDADRPLGPRVTQYRIDGEDFDRLFTRRFGASEVIVPPRSSMIGQRVYSGIRTESGELVVVALLRGDRRVDDPDTRIAAGDTLLVCGTWQAPSIQIEADDEVLVVDEPDVVRRQVVPLGLGAKEAIAVLSVMVVLLATNALPPAVAGLGAGAPWCCCAC